MALLDDATIDERLRALPSWRREGGAIVRDLELPDFAGALRYVNAVGEVAERRNHHPDITIHGWNKVRLVVSNHSEGGLTEADFALAGELDGVPA
jgi:4a-hydroxytetrahydrobiopterin dehydratase